MGIAIPQLAPASEDRASGAQVIDGSLKFDSSKNQFLKQTFGANGNKKTFTYSFWAKKTLASQSGGIIFSGDNNVDGNNFEFRDASDKLRIYSYQNNSAVDYRTTAEYRDTSGWKHILVSIDSTNGTASDRMKLYVNGERVTSFSTSTGTWGDNTEYKVNTSGENHYIGLLLNSSGAQSTWFDGQMSQFYFIDGQALGPENFGYTDPLTNTWRPKKYTGDFNIGSSSLTTQPAPYSAAARFSAYEEFGTVTNNDTGYTLPMSNPSHYGGKVRELDAGGFKVTTVNSATTDFFMGMWVKFETYSENEQFGIDLFDGYVYFETRANGVIGIRQSGGGRVDSSATSLNDGNWHHVALSRTGGTLYGFLDGSAVVNTTSGVSGNSVGANENFWFWGGSGTSYNIDGQVIDPFIYIGQGVSSYTTPTAPLIDASGDINHFSGFSDTQAYYISPGVDVSGSSPNPVPNYFVTGTNSFYLPLDGNSPIGEDKSGAGNNWTPVNFGGSVALDNPQVSGARPILNTDGGGNVARPGVFGSELNQTIAVTVSNASGNNKFYLDGSLTPNLAFTRGSTITFNTGDSTGNGHPFKLSSTNASGSGGTEYTDGVAYYINGSVVSGSDYVTNYSSGAASGFRGIKWTVPHNQSTTYYYCTIHTGMGNNGAFTSTIDETKADLYAWKNVLATPLVGSVNDVSNSVNSGSTTKTITAVGGAAASSAQSNFYGGSFVYDGSGDALKSTSSGLTPGTSDFCCEGWFYYNALPSSSAYRLLGNVNTNANTTDWQLIHATNGTLTIWNGSGHSSLGAAPLKAGCWNHIAYVRDGATHKLYVNGVQMTTTVTRSGHDLTFNGLDIGGRNDGAECINGYVQDVRYYIGTTKYTSNFVVPATSPDILPDTPSGVSGGSKLAKVTDGAVSFDGTGDYLSLAHNSDFDMYDSIYTWDLFFYTTDLSSGTDDEGYGTLFSQCTAGSSVSYGLGFDGSGNLSFKYWNGSGSVSTTATTKIGTNKWYHVAIVKDTASATSGNTKIFLDGKLEATTAVSGTFHNSTNPLEIGADRRSGGGSYDYFQGQISNLRAVKGTALYTTSFNPPTRTLTNVTNTKLLCCQSTVEPGGAAVAPNVSGINNGTQWSNYLTGAGGFQSSYPATNAFNGVITSSSTSRSTNSAETQTFAPPVGIPYSSKVEVWTWYTGNVSLNGGSNVAVSDDQDWRTIATGSGTLNTLDFICDSGNSMYLAGIRIDSTTILLDPIAPYGDAAATNFNPFTTDINAVRGQETGYCTLNPLQSGATLSNGNLDATSSQNKAVFATVPVGNTGGKFYWEATINDSHFQQIGIADIDVGKTSTAPGDSGSEGYIYLANGEIYHEGSTTSTGNPTFTTGDVIGIKYDDTSRSLSWNKNAGSFFGTVTVDDGRPYAPVFGAGGGSDEISVSVNFGQKPFKYAPPDGFQPLNAANVKPVKVIARPDQYVGTTLYTGNNGTQNINAGLKPDFVWIKNRSSSATDGNHLLFDTIRGVQNAIYSNLVDDQDTLTNSLTSFNSDGFTVGGPGASGNIDSQNYVAWTWRAGGAPTATNDNTSGAMDSNSVSLDGVLQSAYVPSGSPTLYPKKMSIGTRQGFSIMEYEGPGSAKTLPHGLNSAPEFILVKRLEANASWAVYHVGTGNTKVFELNGSGSPNTSSSVWNSTTPTSSVWSIGNYADTGDSGGDYLAYLWHSVPGLQKIGSFVGNGSADGVFVETGFKVAWLLTKSTSNSRSWNIWDTARDTYNPNDANLFPHNTNAESSDPLHNVDMLSNGFKLRTGNVDRNGSGETYIYMAWAEAPTFNLYGAQSNAR